MRKRGNGAAFYGDTGTKFTGNAREDIEKQESSGAGHPGNNVDFSQRHAQSEADPKAELEEFGTTPEWKASREYDLPKYLRFLDYIENKSWSPRESRKAEEQEPEDKPFLSKSANDEFWNSGEFKKVIPRKL